MRGRIVPEHRNLVNRALIGSTSRYLRRAQGQDADDPVGAWYPRRHRLARPPDRQRVHAAAERGHADVHADDLARTLSMFLSEQEMIPNSNPSPETCSSISGRPLRHQNVAGDSGVTVGIIHQINIEEIGYASDVDAAVDKPGTRLPPSPKSANPHLRPGIHPQSLREYP